VPEMTKEPVENSVLNPSRRGFAAMGLVAAAWSGSAGAAPLAGNLKPQKTRSLKVMVDGNLFRPEAGEHPGLVMFASAAAAHSTNAAVANQLASQGWAVLLVETAALGDPTRITREARAHVEWLLAQPGVSASASQAVHDDKMHGFTLRGVSAAQPTFSFASREERRSAAACNILFAAPGALLAKDPARYDSLSAATRAIYRRAA
jgi:hypothetical protein